MKCLVVVVLVTLLVVACNRFDNLVGVKYASDYYYVLVNESKSDLDLKLYNASDSLLKEFVINEEDSIVLFRSDWGYQPLIFGEQDSEVCDSLVLVFDSLRYLPLVVSKSFIFDFHAYEAINVEQGDSLVTLFYYTFTEEDYEASMPL